MLRVQQAHQSCCPLQIRKLQVLWSCARIQASWPNCLGLNPKPQTSTLGKASNHISPSLGLQMQDEGFAVYAGEVWQSPNVEGVCR